MQMTGALHINRKLDLACCARHKGCALFHITGSEIDRHPMFQKLLLVLNIIGFRALFSFPLVLQLLFLLFRTKWLLPWHLNYVKKV